MLFRLRCWATVGAATVPTALLGRSAVTALLAREPSAAGAVICLAWLLLSVGAGWAWCAVVAVVLDVARGHRGDPTASAWVPAALRRAVLAACGVALVAGASPTYATAGALEVEHGHHPSPRPNLAGLPLPDRPTGGLSVRQARPTAPVTETDAGSHRRLRVLPGDSLWSLSERHLGSALRWPDLYAVNRTSIGPDPDLIQPGTELLLPTTPRERN